MAFLIYLFIYFFFFGSKSWSVKFYLSSGCRDSDNKSNRGSPIGFLQFQMSPAVPLPSGAKALLFSELDQTQINLKNNNKEKKAKENPTFQISGKIK